MQIKTTQRFHLIPVRKAIIRNTSKNRFWQGCVEIGTLIHLLVGMQTSTTPLEKICRPLKNQNIDLPYNPTIPFLGIYPKDCDTGYSKGTCMPMFIASLFTIAMLWKQPRNPSIDEWIKKMWYLYPMEY
jgi:hypothetical protein